MGLNMALAHPALTTIGHKRTKSKFKSAEEAKRYRELEAEWEKNQKRWANMSPNVNQPVKKTSVTSTVQPFRRGNNSHIPSVDSKHVGAVSSKPRQYYTGDKILGIGTLHKSNAVPVFSNEEATDMAKMRRG